jgi:hypothetical protein
MTSSNVSKLLKLELSSGKEIKSAPKDLGQVLVAKRSYSHKCLKFIVDKREKKEIRKKIKKMKTFRQALKKYITSKTNQPHYLTQHTHKDLSINAYSFVKRKK